MIKRYISVSLVTAAMLMAGCSSSDDDNPGTDDGTTTAGTTDGTTTAGTTDGTTTAGTTDGTTTDGTTDGTTTDGTTDGTTTDGTTTDGTTDGTTTDGTTTDGSTTGGGTTDGTTAADAAALQEFLTTTVTASDDFEVWQCTLPNGNIKQYQFQAYEAPATSGSGFLRDILPAGGSNDLTWQTTDSDIVMNDFASIGAAEDMNNIRINETARTFTADATLSGTGLNCVILAVTE